MLIKTPDLIEAMIELACSRRWLQSTIFVIEFSQHVLQGLWLKDSSLLQVYTYDHVDGFVLSCRERMLLLLVRTYETIEFCAVVVLQYAL